jgi:hypothetical protein
MLGRTESDTYGDVTTKAMALALAKSHDRVLAKADAIDSTNNQAQLAKSGVPSMREDERISRGRHLLCGAMIGFLLALFG